MGNKTTNEEVVVLRGFKRNYRGKRTTDPNEKIHCPYQGIIHDENDERILEDALINAALRKIPEGEIFDLIIRRTGIMSEHSEHPWSLLRPHEYGRADLEEES